MADLENVITMLCAGRESCIVEVGRAVSEGRTRAIGYLWSTGSVGASMGEAKVHLERFSGRMSPSYAIELASRELRRLVPVVADWLRHRHDWGALVSSRGGWSASQHYQESGEDGEYRTVWERSGKRSIGAKFCGRDEVRPLKVAANRPDGAAVVAEIWRVGEQFGPVEGFPLGLRYDLGEGLFLDARREEAYLWRGDEGIHIEASEQAFVSELVTALDRGRPAGG